jgi:hypothetical protein
VNIRLTIGMILQAAHIRVNLKYPSVDPNFIILINLQVKWTLVVCVFCYSSYIAAQFYPRFYTLIPTALVLGLGAAPLWSAESTYLTQVAQR